MEREQLLCSLLQAMLKAALLGIPYPGQETQTYPFPDIDMVKNEDEIVVSSHHVGDSCHIVVPEYTIVVLSEDEVAERTSSAGDFPYFRLKEVSMEADKVALSLELSWAVSEASRQAGKLHLGGGGVRVIFERIAGEWQAPSGPAATWMV